MSQDTKLDLQNSQRHFTMTKVAIEYDYSGVDRIVGVPSTGQLIVFQKQLAKIQTSYKCNVPEAKDHGWSWIMCTPQQWILKRGITSQVTAPADPGQYTGNTNSLKSAYKHKLKLYEEFEEHKRNANKVIQAYFINRPRNRRHVIGSNANASISAYVGQLPIKGGQRSRNFKNQRSTQSGV